MMRLFARTSIVILIMFTGIGFFGCTGGGTEIPIGVTAESFGEPGFVVGRIYMEDGTVASYANVRFTRIVGWPNGQLAKRHVANYGASITSNGLIIIKDTLEDGYYRVEGASGELVSFTDSVYFEDGTCVSPILVWRLTGSPDLLIICSIRRFSGKIQPSN